MTKERKNYNNFYNSNWWLPTKIEKIMLWLTVITVLVSVVAQASSIINNILQFDTIYKKLYPLLNIFHIYVLFYIIFDIRKIKQYLPSPLLFSENDKKKYFDFSVKLKEWIKNHFGEIYWKDLIETETKNNDEKNNNFDYLIKKWTLNSNKNIQKTHTYFMSIFCCLILLYVFELINSLTYSVNEPVLHILTMIINNITTLIWYYIYLTFNITETTTEIDQHNKNIFIKKFHYKIRKYLYLIWRWISLANIFNRPNKFSLFEECNENYKTLRIPKQWNWKLIGFLFLIITIIIFIYFIYFFNKHEILHIEQLIDNKSFSMNYYCFRIVSTISILLGGCAMLATFSRLSSGFHKVPLTAFLIMIFYAALQPLFFAGSEFSSSNMKIGQIIFVANTLNLIGKFGLLYLIKWFFGNYRIAYYFIAGQIIKRKKDLKLDELFS